MDYSNFSKEDLLEKIRELETLNEQLLKEKQEETMLKFSWSGNLGHWYWDIISNKVTFNPLKVTTLGYSIEEIPKNISYQYFTEKLHKEDHKKAMQAMMDHLYGKKSVYEVEYRIKCKDGSYKWYYDRGKITKRNKDGKAIFLAGIVFDITDKKLQEEALVKENIMLDSISKTDELTKLNNRRVLFETLKTKLETKNYVFSVALFDIDDFKKVNDTLGHVYGDKVLADVAGLLVKNVRKKDIVGRYGGEEFLIIFDGLNEQEAYGVCSRILKAVEEKYQSSQIKTTLSCGLKEYDNENLTEFLNKVDNNLYFAKKNGKNKVIAEPLML